MDAESAPDVRLALAERQQVIGVVEAHGGNQESAHAALPRAIEQRAPLVPAVVLQVAVGVDEQIT